MRRLNGEGWGGWMAKDEEVEWRRMRRLNGEGWEDSIYDYIIGFYINRDLNRTKVLLKDENLKKERKD